MFPVYLLNKTTTLALLSKWVRTAPFRGNPISEGTPFMENLTMILFILIYVLSGLIVLALGAKEVILMGVNDIKRRAAYDSGEIPCYHPELTLGIILISIISCLTPGLNTITAAVLAYYKF
jgi:hypothetical protein